MGSASPRALLPTPWAHGLFLFSRRCQSLFTLVSRREGVKRSLPCTRACGLGVVNFPLGHPFRLVDRPPKEGARVGPGLPPPPSPGTWPVVRANFSGPRPRVTCPEPAWKAATAALPPSFFAAPAAYPRFQALPFNLGAGTRDASRTPTPAYLTPVSRGDSPWRWRRGGALATPGPRRGSEARLTHPPRPLPLFPHPHPGPEQPNLRPKAGPP